MKKFGDEIHKKMIDKKMTLRSLWLEIKKINPNCSTVRLSQILRGVYNPANKDEFTEIMYGLNITDPKEIAELEKLAMQSVFPKEKNEEERIQSYPIFFNKSFKDEKELEDFLKKYDQIIDE